MDKRIFFPFEGRVAMLVPTGDISLIETARKDVPAGVPYKIVDVSLVPEDRTFRPAWECDFSNPDGYGIGHEAWFAEQQSKA